MAQVELGIDIDSTDVNVADIALERFKKRVRDASGEFDRLAKSSTGADRGVHGVANAARQADARTAAAAAQMAKLQSSMNGVRTTAIAAGGVLATFLGAGLISSAVGFAQDLEKIERTFTAVTGSAQAARTEMAYVDEAARRLGQNVGVASSAYARLFAAADASNIALADTRAVFEGVTAASATLGLSQFELEGALLAVQQMMSKGKVSAEELRGQLGERLPVAFGVAADAMGMSMAELSKALEDGKVTANDFVGAFGRELLERYGKAAEEADGVTRSVNDLRNAMRDLGVAMAEGGMIDALTTIARQLAEIAKSDAAVSTMQLIGESMKVVAENAEVAAVSVGAMTAALASSPLGRAAGAIVAIGGALAAVRDRTVEIGGEQVRLGSIITETMSSAVAEFQAAGDLIAAVWDYISASAEVIPARLGRVWALIRADFAAMVGGLAADWSNFLGGIADAAAAIPGLGALGDTLRAFQNDAAASASRLGDAFLDAQGEASRLGAEIEGKVGPAWAGVVAAAEAYNEAAKGSATVNQRVAEQTTAARVETEKLTRLTRVREEHETSAAAAAEESATALGAAGSAAGKAAGGAKKMADELARARDVLGEQVADHQRVLDLMQGASIESSHVASETERLSDALRKSGVSLDAFLRTVGMTREEYTAMLRETEKVTAQIDHQKSAASDLVTALRGLAFGTLTGAEGIGGAISALTDGAFGTDLNAALENAANVLTDAFSDAMSGIAGRTGLSSFAVSSIGTGIGIAATGVLQGNAQQIGGGIGSAIGGVAGDMIGKSIGGAVGGIFGPIGMVLGGLAGGFLANLFGGGDDDKWKEVSGRAFVGTTYEADVTTRGTVNTQTDQGFSPEGRFAFDGLVKLMENFNRELREYVEAAGGEVEKGTRLVVNQNAVIEAIAGRTSDLPYKGEAGKEFAEKISGKVAEIMALAATLVQEAGPPLTQAQQLWRETQERFSAENVAILKDLGFSTREIMKAQGDIRRDLAQGFNKEMLDIITSEGGASRGELRQWLNSEMAALREWREASLATAREIGSDTDLVRSAFRAQSRDIRREFREMLEDMAGAVEETATRMERLQFRSGFLGEITGSSRATRPEMRDWFRVQAAILEEQRRQAVREARQMGVEVGLVNRAFRLREVALERQYREMLGAEAERARARELAAAERQAEAAQRRIDTLQGRLNGVEQQRANVLQELTRRAEEARRAEQTLADARASLTAGELAPGGPLDRLAELQRQFSQAIGAAGRGDADAASRAAGLAQTLLQQGQQVYASGGAYSDLFRMVNEQLASVQGRFDNRADRLEARLDAATFTSVTEKSTAALLRGLARLDERLAALGDRIDAQTKRLDLAQQRRSTGRAA